MKMERAYCPKCHHRVRLVFTDPPPHDAQPNVPDGAEIVCLDYVPDCSGSSCPRTGKAGIVMGVRLARSHLNDEGFASLRARCSACGQISQMEILDETFAYCRLCGTTNQWVKMRLDDGSDVVLTEL